MLRDLQATRSGQLAFDFRIDAAPARIIALKPREAAAPAEPPPLAVATMLLTTAERYFLMGSLLDDGTPERQEEASQAYRRALEDDPDLVAALINLANIRYARDELAEAQALYERAILLDPGYFEAHFNLGNIHHDHGRFLDAEACYLRRARPQPRLSRRALLPRGDAGEDGPLERRPAALARLPDAGPARRVGGAGARVLRLTARRPGPGPSF